MEYLGIVTTQIFLQEIVPGVYLGPYASAGKKMAANLKATGITHIVCVRFSHKLDNVCKYSGNMYI